MTNQQILEKAIQKAIDGGWHSSDLNDLTNLVQVRLLYKAKKKDEQLGRYKQFTIDDPLLPPFIFNHDFAKALWGAHMVHPTSDLPSDTNDGFYLWEEVVIPNWQSHLQQMVIAADPIKYLGEHL